MEKPKLAFKQVLLVTLLFVALFVLSPEQTKMYGIEGKTMGTSYVIRSDDANLTSLQNSVDKLLLDFNSVFSTYIEDSEISRWNSETTTQPLPVSQDFFDLAKLAQNYCWISEGRYDITIKDLIDAWGFGPTKPDTIPSDELIDELKQRSGCASYKVTKERFLQKSNPKVKIDLSSIAKGLAVDKIFDLLKSKGLQNFIVEIGGETRVSGKPGEKRDLYKLGISRPEEKASAQDISEILLLRNGEALATSGNYRNLRTNGKLKWAHIINPFTGLPEKTDVISASIVAPNCATADGLATLAMTVGAQRARKILDKMEVEYLLITLDESTEKVSVIRSANLKWLEHQP